MKKAEIKTGGRYLMKVSGKVVPVRVDDIRETNNFKGRSITVYHCTNTITGRKCTAHSAAKFRSEIKPKLPASIGLIPTPNEDERYATMQILEPKIDKKIYSCCNDPSCNLCFGSGSVAQDDIIIAKPRVDSLHPNGF